MTDRELIIMAKKDRLMEITEILGGLESEYLMRKKSLELEKYQLESQLASLERGIHE